MAAPTRRGPVLALAAFASVTQSFVFAGLLTEMAEDLGVSVPAAGQLATVYALAFALSAPFVAAATARRALHPARDASHLHGDLLGGGLY
ncbi:MAG: hypothetical protein ACK5PI_08290, partial [Acetobacteraceae bacterium]